MQSLGLLRGPLDPLDMWLEVLRMGTTVGCVVSQGGLGLKPTTWSLLPCKVREALPEEVPPSSALRSNRRLLWVVSLLSRLKGREYQEIYLEPSDPSFSLIPFPLSDSPVRWWCLEARGKFPPALWFLIGSSLHQTCSHLTTSGRTWGNWGLTRQSSSTTSMPLAVSGKNRVSQEIPWRSSG